MPQQPSPQPAVSSGIPLAEEAGIGALTLGAYLRDAAARFADREAVVMWTGDSAVRWTYDDLWQRALEVARALAACGVGKGTRVALLMTNRPEFLSSLFGVALAGGIASPLSTFSTAHELKALLDQACCSVLLLERHVLKKDFLAMLHELDPDIAGMAPGAIQSPPFPYLRHIAVVDAQEDAGAGEAWPHFLARGKPVPEALIERMAAAVAPSDPGVLFFSSGSTGKPKGILSAHRGVCLQLWRWPRSYCLDDDVRTWSANGFFFSGNVGMAIGSALSTGGALILQRWFDADEGLMLIERERVTHIVARPHQWALIAEARNWEQADLSSLKYIDAQSAVAAHPTVRTDWRNPPGAYGNTETFTISAIYPSDTPQEVHRDSSGFPLPGNRFKIVDPLTGALLNVGERGEIAVKGATLMLGYVGVPLDETLDDEGYFRTGDGGYLDEDGRLYWEGRLTDIIKTGGANVSPLEVDDILRDCPGVKLNQTIGVPDDLLGEMVVSCIVPKEGEEPTEAAIRDFVKAKLASYKVPRKVIFLREEDLSTTGSAKIRTEDLRKLAAARLAPAPAPDTSQGEG